MFDFYPTCLEKTKHVGIFTPGCYFPHMFGFWHTCMGKGTHVWKKPHNYMFENVWLFPHMCGKSHWHAYFPLSYQCYLTLTVPLALVLVTKTLSDRPPEKMMSTMIWMKSFLSTSNILQLFCLTVFSAWRKPCSPRRRKRRSVSRSIGLHRSRTGASCSPSPWTPSHRTRLWKQGECLSLALKTCRRWSTE